MNEFFKKFLPPYFVDKATGVAEREFDSLPEQHRKKLIYGNNGEARQALVDIEANRRMQGRSPLTQATKELIADFRSFAKKED